MLTYWSEGVAPCILNLCTRCRLSGQLHALAALLPVKELLSTLGDWVGPKAGMDIVVRERVPSLPLPGITSQSSSLKSSHYAD